MDESPALRYEATMQPLPALQSLVEVIAGQPHVRRVWLFGSRARGDARPRSDIDLAVEAPAAGRREWLEVCRLIEEAETLLPIDLVRFEEASPSLQQAIQSSGEVLFER